jgi:hypothetical protein
MEMGLKSKFQNSNASQLHQVTVLPNLCCDSTRRAFRDLSAFNQKVHLTAIEG